jgi:hypothetical protein
MLSELGSACIPNVWLVLRHFAYILRAGHATTVSHSCERFLCCGKPPPPARLDGFKLAFSGARRHSEVEGELDAKPRVLAHFSERDSFEGVCMGCTS